MNDFLTRPLVEGDFHACQYLWRACEGVVPREWEDAAAFARLLARNPMGCWAVERHGQLLASVLCGHDGWRGYLYHLAVHPDWRRLGVGRGLVDKALGYLQVSNIGRAHVLVAAGGTQAVGFWQRMGGQLRGDVVLVSLDVAAEAAR